MPSVKTQFKNDMNNGTIKVETVLRWTTETKKGEEVLNTCINSLSWYNSPEYIALATASEREVLNREFSAALAAGAYGCTFKGASAKDACKVIIKVFMQKFNELWQGFSDERKDLWHAMISKDENFSFVKMLDVSDMD